MFCIVLAYSYLCTVKQLLSIFVLLVALCCCTTEADRNRMRSGLDSINARNRNDQPFTVKDVEPYVQFFDDEGTPNDRLLAYYLLGRAYYEAGEAPMALECYQKATECADTTSADCDYPQLARVYGQMAQIFYYQGLYHEQLEYYIISVNYAWRGKDTLAALMNYEQESFAYQKLGHNDSSIIVAEDVARLYDKYGYPSDAAITLGTIVRTLLSLGIYSKAKDYMNRYESESGFFDSLGNIEKGREAYYNSKGLYYEKLGNSDSAEFWYRKELSDGKDFNNQNGAAIGLSTVFLERHKTDSAKKYFQHAFAMNDSLEKEKSTEIIERFHSLYNYTRHKEIARKKSEEANRERNTRNNLALILCLTILAFGLYIGKLVKNRKERLIEYKRLSKELNNVLAEKAALYKHQSEYKEIITSKDIMIAELQRKKSQYARMPYFTTAIAERCLKESPTYKDIEIKAIKGIRLSDDDLSKIMILIKEYLPGFDDFLTTKDSLLKDTESRICILLRLHYKPVDICGMLGMSKPLVSQLSSNILKSIFDVKGSSKELSVKLCEIF